MNYYKLFYWISVADGLKQALAVIAIIGAITAGIAIFIYTIYEPDDGDDVKLRSTKKSCRRFLRWSLPLSGVLWFMSILIPTRSDFILILAGGTLGNFISTNPAAKQLPTNVVTFFNDKILREIDKLHMADASPDTLVNKTKEELIELIKNKK